MARTVWATTRYKVWCASVPAAAVLLLRSRWRSSSSSVTAAAGEGSGPETMMLRLDGKNRTAPA